jgi:hypothetical protein
VKNVPGAGHVIGANEIYAAKPDGLTVGIFNTGLMYAQLLNSEGVQFDLRKMSWIGKAGGEPRVLIVSTKTKFQTLDDVRKADHTAAPRCGGVGDSGYNDMMLLAHALDLKLKHVFGFGDARVAAQHDARGSRGLFGSYSSNIQFVKGRQRAHIFGVGIKEDEPSVPEAADLVTTERRQRRSSRWCGRRLRCCARRPGRRGFPKTGSRSLRARTWKRSAIPSSWPKRRSSTSRSFPWTGRRSPSARTKR